MGVACFCCRGYLYKSDRLVNKDTCARLAKKVSLTRMIDLVYLLLSTG